MLRRCRSLPRIIDGLSHDSAAVLPPMGQCRRYLFGQDWIHEPRTAPADFAFIAPRPLAAAKSLLHLATQAAFLFSTPFWASAGVLTVSIQVAATKAAPATISFIADAVHLAGPILAGPSRRPATPKMGGRTSAEQHRRRRRNGSAKADDAGGKGLASCQKLSRAMRPERPRGFSWTVS